MKVNLPSKRAESLRRPARPSPAEPMSPTRMSSKRTDAPTNFSHRTAARNSMATPTGYAGGDHTSQSNEKRHERGTADPLAASIDEVGKQALGGHPVAIDDDVGSRYQEKPHQNVGNNHNLILSYEGWAWFGIPAQIRSRAIVSGAPAPKLSLTVLRAGFILGSDQAFQIQLISLRMRCHDRGGATARHSQSWGSY